MATERIYRAPTSSNTYTFDFTGDLTGDTVLKDIGSGSTIAATSSDGTDVSATILSSKTRTGMTLLVTLGSMTDGEEYLVTFTAQGNTTSLIVVKTLRVICRSEVGDGV